MKQHSKRKIVKTFQYTLMPVTIAQEGAILKNGRKIIGSGTILGGRSVSVYKNIYEPVVKQNNSEADGVLLFDADVTNGPAEGLLIIHGLIISRCLPEPVSKEAVIALDKITFI